MGTYLSTPVTEKETESGCASNSTASVEYGVVSMQGWRKSMEDAHIVQTDVVPPGEKDPSSSTTTSSSNRNDESAALVFCIFDGHGGSEVARFCQLYFIDVLVHQIGWRKKLEDADVGMALKGCFHGLDDLLAGPRHRNEISHLQTEKPDPLERRTVAGFVAHDDDTFQMTEEKKSDTTNTKPATNEEDDVSQEDSISSTPPDDSLALLKRMLTMAAAREREVLAKEPVEDQEDGEKLSDSPSQEGTEVIDLSGGAVDMGFSSDTDSEGLEDSQTFHASKVLNGRQVCTLPEHPIHAGCTSVCAVVENGTLTVANAGDSRIVLARANGVVEPMSYDHKPTDAREQNRVTEAGGFVNQFGRINGNLNLSRSIGDLKYKAVPGIKPEDQMITAEPDVKQVKLEPDDEFIILGCDGIWDCLTNEEAVQYVQQRIDTKTPTEIGSEMLDDIISVDPRTTAGIGGDNMTVMIVDLQPSTRSRCS